MKTVSEIKFDYVVKECFQNILKPLGFKKKGNNFYLWLTDLGQIINFQKSTLFSKEHISFTINVGLFIPEYWLTYFTYHDGQIPIYPPESMSAIRQRIGKLKYQEDKWFDIDAHTEIEDLTADILDSVSNFILPYFRKTQTHSDVLTLLEDKLLTLDTFTRLIIYGEYKQSDKAQAEYNRLKGDKFVNLNFRQALVNYRDKYGLVDQNYS